MENILTGLAVVFTVQNLLYCFLGCLIGTLTGVLPGVGPVAAIALLLPITYYVPVESVVIMLAGIYYGAQYGGSTTSILVNIPGESSTVMTCLDGHQMALKGRAGPALGISACGSFIGGTLAIIGLQLVAPPLARAAVKFGPPEYVALVILGLSLVAILVKGSILKGFIMAGFGLLAGCVGTDPMFGELRYSFNILSLQDGIGIVPCVMGLFGISEILINIEKEFKPIEMIKTKISQIYPSIKDWRRSIKPILRGSGIGFGLGVLPGGGALLSSFASYATEKKVSKHPEKFGTGVIEGVAGPETANNAAAQSAFIPLVTLGLPSNPVTAILLGGLIIHGVAPGPQLIAEHPQLFWGLVASMYIGNIMLLILNLPLIPLWVKLLRIPYRYLFPLILLFCIIGAYSIGNSVTDILIMLVFGILGYVFRKIEFEGAPFVLGMILGPMFEHKFSVSLIMAGGDLTIFFKRPISLSIFILLAVLTIIPLVTDLKARMAESGFDDE